MAANEEIGALYREAHAAMLEALADLDEAACRRLPAGGNWTIANALAHAVEGEEFWLSQVERLLKEAGARVGRLDEAAQQARERGIQEGARAPYGDMRARFERITIAGQRRLGELSEEALQRSGSRLTDGTLTTACVADLFRQIADHIQEHAEQILELRESP
ncbi:MAG: DinB family protein [Dehalococcoidia bacterium]|nr:DinB family protein [Dehalococcoidia bacterium]